MKGFKILWDTFTFIFFIPTILIDIIMMVYIYFKYEWISYKKHMDKGYKEWNNKNLYNIKL